MICQAFFKYFLKIFFNTLSRFYSISKIPYNIKDYAVTNAAIPLTKYGQATVINAIITNPIT